MYKLNAIKIIVLMITSKYYTRIVPEVSDLTKKTLKIWEATFLNIVSN